jgi:DNA mismatch endonuclease, patch repair protein
MSRIRSKNTLIERKMKELLRQHKIKFNQHPKIFGSPDFLVEDKILIFCDGDFWHGYNYAKKKKPSKKFWTKKIEHNMIRDLYVSRKLRTEGWSVLRFWEHDIENRSEICIRKIERYVERRCC